MTNGTEEPHDMAVMAGEYVLGLMDDAARADFELRLASEPELRRLVAAESERFLELDLTAEGPAPSADHWQRIEQGVARASSNVVDLQARRSPFSAPVSRRGFWQGFAAASIFGIVATSVAYMRAPPGAPRLVVVLLNDQAQPVSIVETLDDKRIRVCAPREYRRAIGPHVAGLDAAGSRYGACLHGALGNRARDAPRGASATDAAARSALRNYA